MGPVGRGREEGSEVTVGSTATSWNLLENLGYDMAEVTRTRCRMQGLSFRHLGVVLGIRG